RATAGSGGGTSRTEHPTRDRATAARRGPAGTARGTATSAATARRCAGPACGSVAATGARSLARVRDATGERRESIKTGAEGDIWITADCYNTGLNALDFSAVRRARVRVARISDAVAYLFTGLILVCVLLVGVGDQGTV